MITAPEQMSNVLCSFFTERADVFLVYTYFVEKVSCSNSYMRELKLKNSELFFFFVHSKGNLSDLLVSHNGISLPLYSPVLFPEHKETAGSPSSVENN